MTTLKTYLRTWCIFILMSVCWCPLQTMAQAVSEEEIIVLENANNWNIMFAPYGWISDIRGNATIRHRTDRVDITFGDILENIDVGAQGHIEVNHGPVTAMVDVTYLKLSTMFKGDDLKLVSHIKDLRPHTFRLSVTSETTLMDAGFFVFFYQSLPSLISDTSTSIELLGGARFLDTNVGLKFNAIGRTLATSSQSWSPIVGVRIKHSFNPLTHVWLRGDFGGFHVDGMDRTWSAIAGLAYSIRPNIDIGIAYRALKMDYNRHAQIGTDVLMKGPIIGISLHN